MTKTNIKVTRLADGSPMEIHELPGGSNNFHHDYGLWILRAVQRVGSQPRDPAHTLPRYFQYYCVAQLVQGRGWYRDQNDRIEVFGAGDVVLVTPGYIHGYGGDQTIFMEDTICFVGSVADSLHKVGVIKDGIFHTKSQRILKPIIELAADPARDAQLQANIAAQKLLVDLYLENCYARAPQNHDRIVSLLKAIHANPSTWWTVKEMADFCKLCEMQFRRIFYEVKGVKPKRFIEQLKVNKAIEQLADGNKTIAQIAENLGYADPFHFSRRFKHIVGVSPSRYRRANFHIPS